MCINLNEVELKKANQIDFTYPFPSFNEGLSETLIFATESLIPVWVAEDGCLSLFLLVTNCSVVNKNAIV